MQHTPISAAEASPSALAAFLLLLPREHLEAATEALIVAQDVTDGDPDVELDGDELDGNGLEDDFMLHEHGNGAGCPVSDPGEEDGEDCCEAGDDDPTDLGCLGLPGSIARHCAGNIVDNRPGDPDDAELSAWTEWHTRGRHKLAPGGFEASVEGYRNRGEDDEDDGDDTGVEDGPFDPEEDRCAAGDDGCGAVLVHGQLRWGSEWDADMGVVPTYGVDQTAGPNNEAQATRSHFLKLLAE